MSLRYLPVLGVPASVTRRYLLGRRSNERTTAAWLGAVIWAATVVFRRREGSGRRGRRTPPIWQGGGGIAQDEAGDLYVMTGNYGIEVPPAGRGCAAEHRQAPLHAAASRQRPGRLDAVAWFTPFHDSDRNPMAKITSTTTISDRLGR